MAKVAKRRDRYMLDYYDAGGIPLGLPGRFCFRRCIVAVNDVQQGKGGAGWQPWHLSDFHCFQ